MKYFVIKSFISFLFLVLIFSIDVSAQDKVSEIVYEPFIVNRHKLQNDTVYERKGEIRDYVGSWREYENKTVYHVFKLHGKYYLQKIYTNKGMTNEYFDLELEIKEDKLVIREAGNMNMFYHVKDGHLYMYNQDNTYRGSADKYEI